MNDTRPEAFLRLYGQEFDMETRDRILTRLYPDPSSRKVDRRR